MFLEILIILFDNIFNKNILAYLFFYNIGLYINSIKKSFNSMAQNNSFMKSALKTGLDTTRYTSCQGTFLSNISAFN